jgi:bifunctional UDP-N-acetylglucosamine pyrophosphorylase/glucosamine-1-phosphate N-acetyltransferase
MPLEVIVLAAGLGKRMRSGLPKVLQPLAGRPLLAHVVESARALSPRKIIVVHGHGAEQVRATFADGKDIEWVLQAEQLGTGHAVQQAAPRLGADADVLILYGDVPLVRPQTLKQLLDSAKGGLAVLTVDLAEMASRHIIARGPRREARAPSRSARFRPGAAALRPGRR